MTAEDSPLEARLAELEQRVAALEARAGSPRPAVAATPAPPLQVGSRRPVRAARPDDWFRRGEGWLGRAGIGLLAFGLIFLFRYAVERGWLSPATRIAMGLVAGAALFAAGDFFFRERRNYRQILMGAGITLLLITALAASLLYQMISSSQALACFVLITGLALVRAQRKGDSVLASAMLVGALLPAAALLQPQASPAFWYYLLVVGSLGAIAAAQSGSALLVATGTLAALIAYALALPLAGMQASELLATAGLWLGYAALPLLRGHVRGTVAVENDPRAHLRVVLPIAVSVVLALVADERVLRGTHTAEIALALFALAALLLAAWLLHRRAQPATGASALLNDAFSAAATCGLVLGALATVVATPAYGPAAAAAFGTVAYFAATRLRAPLLTATAYVLFVAFGMGFVSAIGPLTALGVFDLVALAYAGGGLLVALVALRARGDGERLAFWGGVFVMVHVLLATELGAVPGATWLGSAGYALVGSGLVLAGLRREQRRIQQAGLLSLALLVVRLFAYDTVNAGTGVRIVLFAACGGAFLLLSYFFRGRRVTS